MPTLTNVIRTLLQGDARSYVQATQQATTATDRFIASYQRAQRSVGREFSLRKTLGDDTFEQGLAAFKAQEDALTRQKGLRRDLLQQQETLNRAQVVATAGAVAFDAALVKVVRTGTERQSSRLTFENQFGRGAGGQMFGDLGKIAQRSPFSADALRDSALSLREMGVDAREIVPDLQALGNAAAFTGRGDEGIKRLSGALAQARQEHVAAPLIGAMEAEGLRPFDILQKKLGLNRPAVQQMANDFASSDRLLKALMDDMRSLGGGRAMEERMGTAAAATEKFHDALKDLQDEIGTGILPSFTDLTHKATEAIRGLSPETKGAMGTGLVVGGGAANLLATLGIPAATAWNTWKIAQIAKGAAPAVAGGTAAAGEGVAATMLARVAPLVRGPVLLPALIGAAVAKATGNDPLVGGGLAKVIAQRFLGQGGGGGGSVPGLAGDAFGAFAGAVRPPGLTPAEQAHLDELKKQSDLLEQQNALLGRATIPGGQGVVPFSEVPLRRQLAFQDIHRKGG